MARPLAGRLTGSCSWDSTKMPPGGPHVSTSHWSRFTNQSVHNQPSCGSRWTTFSKDGFRWNEPDRMSLTQNRRVPGAPGPVSGTWQSTTLNQEVFLTLTTDPWSLSSHQLHSPQIMQMHHALNAPLRIGNNQRGNLPLLKNRQRLCP